MSAAVLQVLGRNVGGLHMDHRRRDLPGEIIEISQDHSLAGRVARIGSFCICGHKDGGESITAACLGEL
jgi:hypothetical protein